MNIKDLPGVAYLAIVGRIISFSFFRKGKKTHCWLSFKAVLMPNFVTILIRNNC